MKAAVLTQFNTPLHIQELDVPSPDYGQVLVKIYSSGICGAQLGQIGGTKILVCTLQPSPVSKSPETKM